MEKLFTLLGLELHPSEVQSLYRLRYRGSDVMYADAVRCKTIQKRLDEEAARLSAIGNDILGNMEYIENHPPPSPIGL
jgi:hypothetical protein